MGPSVSGIFESFDVTATYDTSNRRLELAATVMPELVAQLDGQAVADSPPDLARRDPRTLESE